MLATVAAVATGYNVRTLPRAMHGVRALAKLSGGARSGSPAMEYTTEETGEFGTTEYKMTFMKDGKPISPWHDVPLEAGNGLYNMLTEIPKMTLKKMEVSERSPARPLGRWPGHCPHAWARGPRSGRTCQRGRGGGSPMSH
jgi:inorganic pyrophosphatase